MDANSNVGGHCRARPRVLLSLMMICTLVLSCTDSGGISGADVADYVIENVTLVPMYVDATIEGQYVAVKDGLIASIGDQRSGPRIAAETYIDGTGKFLMPGLADMHAHMRMNPQAMFNLFLANGVTTVMNMRLQDGGGTVDHLQLRSDVAAGQVHGPRYLVSGPQLSPDLLPDLAAVDAMLDMHVEEGFDTIKIHEDLPFPIFDALVRNANARGLRVTGHLQHHLPLSQSLRMTAIEHAEEFLYTSIQGFGPATKNFGTFLPAYYAHVERMAEPDYRRQIVEEIAGSGVFVDPTLVIYRMVSRWADPAQLENLKTGDLLDYLPERTRDFYLDPDTNPYQQDFPLSPEHLRANQPLLLQLVAEFQDAGVPLLLGTDSLGTLVPGFSVHDELALLVDAGLSPFEALQAGTTNVAAYLDESDRAGSIEIGKRADLVLIDGNPLENIANTRRVRGVLTHGNWYSATDIQSLLTQARLLNREAN